MYTENLSGDFVIESEEVKPSTFDPTLEPVTLATLDSDGSVLCSTITGCKKFTLGNILKAKYNTPESAKQLVSMGDAVEVAEDIETSTFYARDLRESEPRLTEVDVVPYWSEECASEEECLANMDRLNDAYENFEVRKCKSLTQFVQFAYTDILMVYSVETQQWYEAPRCKLLYWLKQGNLPSGVRLDDMMPLNSDRWNAMGEAPMRKEYDLFYMEKQSGK